MKNSKQKTVRSNQFGTFGGVFTPSILTILGVIMFMRAGFVIGQAGIAQALLILLLSKLITFFTGLSISAISTNTPVAGGGAYFLISRVLGPQFGGAIGIALFFAQAFSVPFYILGFVEAITLIFPDLPIPFIALTLSSAVILFIITYSGAGWAIKVQYGIMTLLTLSVLTFLIGALTNFNIELFRTNFHPEYTSGQFNFWSVFAIYFPAATGIMAGVNMSGDLKNPEKSIPRGTLLAIGVGFIIYFLQIIIIGGAQQRSVLISHPFETLMSQSLFGLSIFVALGVLSAILSSAIGSFMGAPRVLQALASDNIIKLLKPLARGSKEKNEPQRAIILTALITFAVLVLSGNGKGGGALNLMATVITMFFLYTYGMTNLAAFIESVSGNPSFRPRFKMFHWSAALLGGAGCVIAAFLIHFWAAVIAVSLIGLLYYYISRKVLTTTFGDARKGFYYSIVRKNLLKLVNLAYHPKNWRPTILVFSGNPNTRLTMVKYAVWFENGKGIVTLAEILSGEFSQMISFRKFAQKRLQDFINKNNIHAFTEVIIAKNFDEGMKTFLQGHSIGPIKPNLIMFGWPGNQNRVRPFIDNIKSAYQLDKSLVIVVDRGIPFANRQKRIDIWWRGKENGSLMLILAYLLSQNWEWVNTTIRLIRQVNNPQGERKAYEVLTQLASEARIKAEVKIVVSKIRFNKILHKYSKDADVVFLGIKKPQQIEAIDFYQRYNDLLEGMPTTLLVLSTGEADLLA